MANSINGGSKHIKQNRTFSKTGEGDFRYISSIQTRTLREKKNRNQTQNLRPWDDDIGGGEQGSKQGTLALN